MLRKTTLVALALMISAAAAFGQTATGSDPVSGMWGRKDGAGLELKFDGTRGVTGTVYITGAPSATIRKGTYDPQTRTVRLEGDATARDGRTGPFVIEGTVDGDTINASYTFGTDKGTATLTRAGAVSSAPVSAVDPVFGRQFSSVSGWVTKAAEMVPADKYSYRPATTVRTFGQIVAHIADSYNYSCANAAGKKIDWADPIEKGPSDKATIVAALKKATDGCTAAYGAATDTAPLIENIGHTNLHYGNIITYMRMLGLVPPSS